MQHLILLHGALASHRQMLPLKALLEKDFDVRTFDFTGHGGSPIPESKIQMETFVDDILRYLEAHNITSAHVFGYSMGGYAALCASSLHPEKFSTVMTLGTKFDWSPGSAAAELQLLDTDLMVEKIPGFVEQLKKNHAPSDWREVVNKTGEMMRHLGEYPLLSKEVLMEHTRPTLVLVGELDNSAGVGATYEYASIHPMAEVFTLPNTPHPFDKVDPTLIAENIQVFVRKNL